MPVLSHLLLNSVAKLAGAVGALRTHGDRLDDATTEWLLELVRSETRLLADALAELARGSFVEALGCFRDPAAA